MFFSLIFASSPNYYQNLQLFSLESEDGQKMARIPQMGLICILCCDSEVEEIKSNMWAGS